MLGIPLLSTAPSSFSYQDQHQRTSLPMSRPCNRICRVGGSRQDAYTYYPVLIIGAGESGIAMGCRLRQVLKFDQFCIVDRRSGIGGTWHANTYPGVACDM